MRALSQQRPENDRSRLRRAVAMEGDLLGAGPRGPQRSRRLERHGAAMLQPRLTRVRRPGRGFHRWPAAAFSDWR